MLSTLLALAVVCPAYMAKADSIDDQKTQIQNQYKSQRDSENQDYQNRINDAKSKYQGDQLTAQKKQLELEHTKKLQDLASDEKINLQKLDAQRHQ